MQPLKTITRDATHLIFIISALLIAYNVARVLSISIIYDEAATYMFYVNSSFSNIVACNPVSANDHIFNSLLAKVSVEFFNPGIFSLRLPNILAHMVYLVYSYLLLRKVFYNKWQWVLCGFLLLNLNPFLFDFWGLCRGYGLSVAFMTASVYYLFQYIKYHKRLHLFLCLLAGILATYSNFCLLHYYLAVATITCIDSLRSFKRYRKGFFKNAAMLLAATVLLCFLIYQPIVSLHKNNQLYFGGDNGLIQDSFYTLIRESLFVRDTHKPFVMVLAYSTALFIIVPACYWLFTALTHTYRPRVLPGIVFTSVLCISLLSVLLQHVLLGNKYLIERTAVFLYPLFALHFLYWLYILPSRQAIITGCLAAITAVCLLNFTRNMNVSVTRTWPFNVNDKLVIERMMYNNHGKPIDVEMHWLFHVSIWYYAVNYYQGQFVRVENMDLSADTPRKTKPDYYYILKENEHLIPPAYILDTSFFNSAYLLYKKSDPATGR